LADLVLLVHAAATLVMVGIIWFVQVVHYPLFARVGTSRFPAYSEAHSRLTGYVVGPPMLAEMATAILLPVFRPAGVAAYMAWTGLLLLVLVWLSTALLQVPRHKALGTRFDDAAWKALVLTNWVRTACWSLRGLLVMWMLSRTMV
jgi:hypothetical protein